jgi:hypothetical protein
VVVLPRVELTVGSSAERAEHVDGAECIDRVELSDCGDLVKAASCFVLRKNSVKEMTLVRSRSCHWQACT